MAFFSGTFSVLIQIIAVIFGLGLLVFLHELGHFLTAKYYGVRILKFALGFGPEIYGWTKGETRYSVCLFPLGGLVEMAGEYSEANKANKEQPVPKEGDFLYLKWYKKAIIAFMGPFTNYVLAVILFWFVFSIWGVQTVSTEAVIGNMLDTSCAKQAGLMLDDKIVSINGIEINNWNELTSTLKDKAKQQTEVTILRDGKEIKFSLVIDENPTTGGGMLGIQPKVTTEKTSVFKAFYLGIDTAVYQSTFTLAYLWDKLVTWEKPEIAGPIGVIQVMAKSANSGFGNYFRLLAVISVALGLFNLLPIPLVDGGMIVLYFVEGIIRKTISMKVIQIYNSIGLSLILLIFIFATYSDLIRLGIGKLFK